MKHSKIAVIGAGSVGSTTAYALLLKNIAAEIILVDIDEKRCHGEILDLSDALAFDGTSKIRSGNAQDAAQADIIVIAAGKAQKPGETRHDLLAANTKIISDIFTAIKPINPAAIVIMVTNPLDALTMLAQSLAELPRNQIFGSGTFLDTMRLRGIIADKLNIARTSVHAYVIGEHGDSQIVAWSCAEIAGTPIEQFPGVEQKDFEVIAQEVKNIAYNIIACKGSTHFGIAACVAHICQAIIFNQKVIIPLSTYIEEYDTVFSMPCVLGENGIEKIISIPLNESEEKKLKISAQELKNASLNL
jgi:L-lactate dehydrogenase